MELPSTGDVFEDKYQIHQVIGKGGFATVYRATDLEVGRDVALKILSPQEGGYAEAVVARFMREARLLAGLQDPHTITMFDFGRTNDGLLFMVFEYVNGVDLAEVLKRREKLPHREVRHIVKQVLYALREAHDAGVYHRDIKPANLLVYEYMGDPNCVKLLDFGVAKPGESHPLGPANLTRKGAMVGTPRYMAPEQIYGRDITPAADIYSLGLVAYEMLTGKPAMDAKTNKDRVRQQLSDEPTRVPEDVGTPDLRKVINRMIEKDPLARYASADQALRALRGEAVDPPKATPPRRRPTELADERSDTIDESALPLPPAPGRGAFRVLSVAAATLVIGLVSFLVVRQIASRPDVVELGADTTDAPVPPEPDPVVPVDEPPHPTETPHEEPEVAAPKAQKSGCGVAAKAGLKPYDLLLDFRQRRFLVYVPRDYDPEFRHRIVVMFHGISSSPRDFISTTNMAELADEKRLLLVVPEAKDATAEWKEVENFDLVTQAIEQTRRDFCVDPGYVYALGHGRGGRFARDLPCYVPLSAVAVTGIGQAVGEDACISKTPVPRLRLFGNADPYVPMNGGPGCLGGAYLSAREIDEQWVQHYLCDDAPLQWAKEKNGVCRTWKCQVPGATAVSCELKGGHDWPGTPPRPTFPNCQSPPANFPYRDTIWRFFEQEGREI